MSERRRHKSHRRHRRSHKDRASDCCSDKPISVVINNNPPSLPSSFVRFHQTEPQVIETDGVYDITLNILTSEDPGLIDEIGIEDDSKFGRDAIIHNISSQLVYRDFTHRSSHRLRIGTIRAFCKHRLDSSVDVMVTLAISPHDGDIPPDSSSDLTSVKESDPHRILRSGAYHVMMWAFTDKKIHRLGIDDISGSGRDSSLLHISKPFQHNTGIYFVDGIHQLTAGSTVKGYMEHDEDMSAMLVPSSSTLNISILPYSSSGTVYSSQTLTYSSGTVDSTSCKITTAATYAFTVNLSGKISWAEDLVGSTKIYITAFIYKNGSTLLNHSPFGTHLFNNPNYWSSSSETDANGTFISNSTQWSLAVNDIISFRVQYTNPALISDLDVTEQRDWSKIENNTFNITWHRVVSS